MRQQKGEIVLNGLVLLVDPYLFAKDADPVGTAKTSLIVGLLAKLAPPSHGKILSQVMPIMQHLLRLSLAVSGHGDNSATSRVHFAAAQAQAAKLRAESFSSEQAYCGHATWITEEMSPGK
jgi:hypothetical protein